MTNMLSAPYLPMATFRRDSRYFWLGEWLMYPWQIIVGVTDMQDIGAAFEDIFRPWGSRLLMNLHYWNAPNAIGTYGTILGSDELGNYWHRDRNRRVSPINVLLARTFWNPAMYESGEGMWKNLNIAVPWFPGAVNGVNPEEIHHTRDSHALEALEPISF